MSDVARRIYDRAMAERQWRKEWAKANPTSAAYDRRVAKANGWPAHCDDPTLMVRTSDLIALCAPLIGEPVPVDPNQPELFTEANA